MQNLYKDLEKILLSDKELKSEDEKLLKNKITEMAVAKDKKLLTLLSKNAKIKKHFFVEIDKDKMVFDLEKFISFINTKEFLPNSFTSFKNQIGLQSGGEYISPKKDVSLVWAYKDCVLEGGQDFEDQKRNEVFYNEILAPDEIDRLLDKKVLTNFKKYSKNKETKPNNFYDENLIIKGNNLLALSSISEKFRNKVKLIYIDPPYYFPETKSGDTFSYNTNFKLSSWLVFMKNRLEIARDILSDKGSIFVQISDDGSAHLKLLMDEIFGRDNFVNVVSVRMKNIAGASGGGEDKKLKKNIEFIYIYSKNEKLFESFQNVYDYKELYSLVQDYKENEVSWKYTSVLISGGNKKYIKSTVDGDGNEIKIYSRKNSVSKSISQIAKEDKLSEKEAYYKYIDKIYTTAMPQSSIRTRVLEALGSKVSDADLFSIEYIPRSGRNKGKMIEQFYKGKKLRLFSWLKDVVEKQEDNLMKKELQGTYWDGFNLNNLSKEGRVQLENGKKPEALLERIINMATDKGDWILDYHLGSGTTCAVAHKMNRKYIGIEQLDYGENDSVERLKNVINSDKSGISKSVDWKGGGSFVYAELKELNQSFVENIKKANATAKLKSIHKKMQEEAFFRYDVDLSKFNQKEFEKLSVDEQKQVLLECLDKNHLYVNYSEMGDSTYKISAEDKKLNKLFYEKK